jgi:hypothetical protein
MFNREELGCVMNNAAAVVVVTNRAVKQVIRQDSVKRIGLRSPGFRRIGPDVGACDDWCSARADELAIDLHQAGVTGLDWAELRMETDLGTGMARAVEKLDEEFPSPRLLGLTVYLQL